MPATPSCGVTIALANLEFVPQASLLLCTEDSQTERAVRARLSCHLETQPAELAFCTTAAALVEEIGANHDIDVAARIAGFVELFRGLRRQVTDADVIGLWGELALIAFSNDPIIVAQAWHLDPDDVVDFELDGSRLEVKTTRDPSRSHWFSHDQLTISDLAPVALGSLIAVPSKTGSTLADLLGEATKRLAASPALAEQVVAIATKCVGDALSESKLCFEPPPTLRSLRLMAFQDIPRVDVEDDRIVEVNWKAALASVPDLPAEIVQASRLLSALPKY
jgi:hypothetical protein